MAVPNRVRRGREALAGTIAALLQKQQFIADPAEPLTRGQITTVRQTAGGQLAVSVREPDGLTYMLSLRIRSTEA